MICVSKSQTGNPVEEEDIWGKNRIKEEEEENMPIFVLKRKKFSSDIGVSLSVRRRRRASATISLFRLYFGTQSFCPSQGREIYMGEVGWFSVRF